MENRRMDERVKFVIVLRAGSETEALFHQNYDTLDGERKVLFCSSLDLSGYHAKIVRIPSETSKAGLRQVGPQTFWFPAADVALAFEYDARNPSVGFG